MDKQDIQRRLTENGFSGPDAVTRFQRAFANQGAPLDDDGIAGPLTQAALMFLPNLSPHFTAQETACKHCGQVGVRRELLEALEALRTSLGRPVSLVSVYRCPAHNKAVGGAQDSMHVLGAAADLRTVVSISAARRAKRFSGIGTRGSLASHIDVRHLMGSANRTPRATPANPERWVYS